MKNITLKQLRYFEAVAAHQHFGRAAQVCSISQPALSVQIKELEQSLGAALFERSARKVALTAFGEEFGGRVREILRSVDDLEDLARASRGGFVGKVRIGIIPTIAPYLLPRIIENLNQSHSGLDVHVRETQTEKLINELLEGQLDAAVVALPISEPALTEVFLFEESFVLVRNQQYAKTPMPRPDQLHEMKLLLLEEGHCFRDQALSFCGLRPAFSRGALDGSSLSTLVQMVGAGIGVTLIPEMAIGVETHSAAVSISRFENPQPARKIGMIWRKTSPLFGQLMEISEVVQKSAVEIKNKTT